MKEPEKGIMDGIRRFIETDNHIAVDVGGLRRDTIPVRVKKPHFSEAFPEAVFREGADELTLRAGEVGTQRAFINTDHTEFERWGPPLVDTDCHAFCQTIYKGIEGDEWEELYYDHRELSQAAGAKKPCESQNAKALWAMKAAWDRSEEYSDPVRKEDILDRTKNPPGFVGRTSQRPDCGPGKSFGMLGESLQRLAFGLTVCCCQPLSSQWLAASLAQRFCKRCGMGPVGKASGLAWTRETCCVFAHTIQQLKKVLGKYGPHSELFFFLIRKEPAALTQAVPFKPVVFAEKLKACALIGLHSRR